MNLKRKFGYIIGNFIQNKHKKLDLAYISEDFYVLNKLPLELKHKIFSYLKIVDLMKLCDESKEIESIIFNYLEMKSCSQTHYFNNPHLSNNHLNSLEISEQYRQLAMLYRKLLDDSSFSRKLEFLSGNLKRHLCFSMENYQVWCSSECDVLSCRSMNYFGLFLREFIVDWTETHMRRLFQTLIFQCFQRNFWRELTSLLVRNIGISGDVETRIRLFLRRIFLIDRCNNFEEIELAWNSIDTVEFVNRDEVPLSTIKSNQYSDNSSKLSNKNSFDKVNQTFIWLTETLKSYSSTHQARIIFILFGPFHRNRLLWSEMCQHTAADRHQIINSFGELGWVFRCLVAQCHFSVESTLDIIQNLTWIIPDEWLSENIASMLYTSGFELTNHYISERVINSSLQEVAMTITSLCLVSIKINNHPSTTASTSTSNYSKKCNNRVILSLLENAVHSCNSSKDRHLLLEYLSNAFKEVIEELYLSEDMEDRLEDFGILLKAQSNFMSSLLYKLFED